MRPRLAIVIAIVTTLAGLLALTRIPVAQLPDIVPPQVEVTATYPGASAAVSMAWPMPTVTSPPVQRYMYVVRPSNFSRRARIRDVSM